MELITYIHAADVCRAEGGSKRPAAGSRLPASSPAYATHDGRPPGARVIRVKGGIDLAAARRRERSSRTRRGKKVVGRQVNID